MSGAAVPPPDRLSSVSGGLHAAQDTGALTVLIVDERPEDRAALSHLVTAQGHRAVATAAGPAALQAFLREHPDLVLLDAASDAERTAEYLRVLSGDGFVPVVLLMPAAALAAPVDAGAWDRLGKPVQPEVLRAKLEGFARLRRLLHTMRLQRDALARHNQWLRREYQVAEAVFAEVMHSEALRSPHIRCLVSPQAVFNGDLVLAAHRPSGELQLMVGDFTGHGLSAAIGAIPVADIFHGMTAKGFPIPEIVAEINQKLLRILPRGLFLAAALVELDAASNTLSVWNGGMPDVLVTGGEREPVRARVASHSFPLGVVETAQLDCTTRTLQIGKGSRILLYTDGLTEAENGAGERFGAARLEACLGRGDDCLPTFERILSDLQDFRGPREQADDLTLVEVVADPAVNRHHTAAAATEAVQPRAAAAWRAAFSFGVDSLRAFDPVPSLMHFLLDAQRLHAHKQRIYMVLAELFTNAVEHGLLGLDSAIKAGPDGFSAYYREKERRLREATTGEIRVELEHAACATGGRLVIRVEDSGPGFDFAAALRMAEESHGANGRYFGRGIAAVRDLCAELSYHGRGNRAEAVYLWHSAQPGS